jgi:hypothetical protein
MYLDIYVYIYIPLHWKKQLFLALELLSATLFLFPCCFPQAYGTGCSKGYKKAVDRLPYGQVNLETAMRPFQGRPTCSV